MAIVDLRQGISRVANMLSQGRQLVGLVDKAGEKLLEDLLAENKLARVKSYLSLEAFNNGFTPLNNHDDRVEKQIAHAGIPLSDHCAVIAEINLQTT